MAENDRMLLVISAALGLDAKYIHRYRLDIDPDQHRSIISPVTLCSNVLVGFAEANKKFSEVGPKSGGTLWPSEKSAIES